MDLSLNQDLLDKVMDLISKSRPRSRYLSNLESRSRSRPYIFSIMTEKFVDRTADLKTIETGIRNKFRWQCLEEKDCNGD